MRNKTERKALHTSNLKTTVGHRSTKGLNRERVYTKNQKTYKQIKANGQNYFIKLDIKEK
tara:strand:+ start:8665 stop:8844 length:180 start_codon:yes stop_codon:yes gene_type:complete